MPSELNGLYMRKHQPTLYEIAYHFYVSHISGAITPHTRLSNILNSVFHGRPITALALGYLQKQGLTELYQLASDQITYEVYITSLAPTVVAREHAAREAHANAQKERATHDAMRIAEAKRKQESIKIERREREHKQKQVELDQTAQAIRNREIAQAMYEARMSTSNAQPLTASEISQHFRMDLRPDIAPLNAPLRNILEALYQGTPLASTQLKHLKAQGLIRLHELASGLVTYDSYVSSIDANERIRTSAAATKIAQSEEERVRRETAEAARIARESDPVYRLRKKYGIEEMPPSLQPRMMGVVYSLDAGKRITDDDFVWLTTNAKNFFSDALREAYHLCEAQFFANEFAKTQNPWKAINASSHYRKCKQPEAALQLLDQIPPSRLKDPKPHSAFCTTRGGVLRDLRDPAKAFKLGKQAHQLQPHNFRPCTLLGALSIEQGRYAEGHEWYAKAEQRGATQKGIDRELRLIYLRADKAKRQEMRNALLLIDPIRYSWVNKINDDNQQHRTSRHRS